MHHRDLILISFNRIQDVRRIKHRCSEAASTRGLRKLAVAQTKRLLEQLYKLRLIQQAPAIREDQIKKVSIVSKLLRDEGLRSVDEVMQELPAYDDYERRVCPLSVIEVRNRTSNRIFKYA